MRAPRRSARVMVARSTQATRGELAGPAPSPRQVRRVIVQVDQPARGLLRLTTPSAPGWAATARNPYELARALELAFVESQVAAYSKFRQCEYDMSEPEQEVTPRRRPRRRSASRCDVHDPREWTLTADGRWKAPGGNKYRESTDTVQRVMQARMRMGLSAHPDVPEQRGLLGKETG